MWYNIRHNKRKAVLSMEKVHISQLYPCSTIKIGSELYYICELAKYLKNEDKQLDLDGVIISKGLSKSHFWNYFLSKIKEGLITGANIKSLPAFIEVEGVQDIDLTDENHEPIFKEKTDDMWLWTLRGNSSDDETKNSLRLNGTLRSHSWVSLTAMVAVHRLLHNNVPKKLRMEFDNSITYQNMAVSDIILIKEETEAFGDWVELQIDNELQSYYEAWYQRGYDQGYFREFVYAKDKFEFMKSHNYFVGCPVFLYQRENKRKGDPIKAIKNCSIAIIREMSKSKVVLDVLSTKETRYMAYLRYENFSPEVKQMYNNRNPFKKVNVHRETFDLLDLGVDMLMYKEEWFISDVNKDDMVVLSDVKDVNVVEENDGYLEEDPIHIELSSQQAVYWVLKDWGVEFDEEKYTKLFLKEGVGMYDVYKDVDKQ